MKQIKILVSFEDNEMIFPNIELVKNDYNHVEFIFDFDEDDDDGKKVFELKKPNGKVFIKEIIDNRVVLSDLDEKGNVIPVINQSGKYEFEITKYKSDSKFTINKTCHFVARDEVVNVDDDIVDKDASLPILKDLITTTIALKENTEKIGQLAKEKGDYAEKQGNYAKEAASNVINANSQATELINNFESNVNKYTASFNKNATTKQEKFDSNSTTKINEYNDNATLKLKSYNDNHEVKMKDYNDNANEKTKIFNSNVEIKTTDYNKNADDKLNSYNKNDATKLEEYNNNATQKLEEYDEHSEELNNKINSTNSELEKLKDEILETAEVSDSYIHVEDSKLSKLKSLSVDGVCQQETTTGKNLLDYVSNIISSANGLTSVINEDGSITTTGKPTKNYSTIVKGYSITDILEDGQTYTILQAVASPKLYIQVNARKSDNTYTYIVLGDNFKKNKSFKVDKTTYLSYSITVQTCTTEYWGDSSLTITNKYMLCKGTDTAEAFFEPYTGGISSPNPDYPQQIKTITGNINLTNCNKNLISPKIVTKTVTGITFTNNEDGSYTLNGTATANFSLSSSHKKITFEKGNYTFSNGTSLPENVWYSLISDDSGAPNYIVMTLSKLNTRTITFDNRITYNRLREYIYINSGTTLNNLIIRPMLVKENNSTSTIDNYVKNIQSQITANLPEGEFIGKIDDTYKDTLCVDLQDDGKYHLVLNKQVRYLKLPIADMNNSQSYPGWKGTIVQSLDTDFPRINQRLSLHTTYISNATHNLFSYNLNTISSGTPQLFLSPNHMFGKTMTQTEIKEQYADLILDIYYGIPEKNQYKIDLGIVDMPFSFDEVTNIFTDSELLPRINATYYKNFISTIRNLKVNNETLKNELVSINNRLAALENANAIAIGDEEESEVIEK